MSIRRTQEAMLGYGENRADGIFSDMRNMSIRRTQEAMLEYGENREQMATCLRYARGKHLKMLCVISGAEHRQCAG
jgi:AICAR transformylase/IMP cyclohydrolase PurH